MLRLFAALAALAGGLAAPPTQLHHCAHDAVQSGVQLGFADPAQRGPGRARRLEEEALSIDVRLEGTWGGEPAVPEDLGDEHLAFALKVSDLVQKRAQALLSILEPHSSLSWTSADACYIGADTFEYNFNGPLADVDYALFLSISESSCGSSTLAWATSCLIDTSNGQPVVGVANICRDRLEATDVTDPDAFEYWLDVMTHEFFHALGFSGSFVLLASSGNTFEVEERGHTVTKLSTANALAAARDHFGCSSLDGVELEDQGASGTVGSHLEGRIFFNELMTGVINYPTALSAVTLGVLEDTGFYAANYDYAEPLPFGLDQGCDFATDYCLTGGESVSAGNEYCAAEAGRVCTHDRSGIGECALVTYQNSLDSYYRYFSNVRVGGAFSTMDYCPVIERYDDGGCERVSNQEYTSRGERYGFESLCFESTATLTASGETLTDDTAACLLHDCSSAGTLSISLVDENDQVALTLECPSAGGYVEAGAGGDDEFQGAVLCPPAAEICGVLSGECPNDCSGNGNCVDGGVCACTHFDYAGDDCSEEICPSACSGANGACDVDTGECECFGSFSGDACDTYACESRDDGCNGHGDCVAELCECDDNWGGGNCDEPDCSGDPDCAGRGVCGGDSGCACDSPYTGDGCDALEAGASEPTAFECLNACSGHGDCTTSSSSGVEVEACACREPYYGGDCSASDPQTFASLYLTTEGSPEDFSKASQAALRVAMADVLNVHLLRVVLQSVEAGDGDDVTEIQTAVYAPTTAQLESILSAADDEAVRVELSVALSSLGANYTIDGYVGRSSTEAEYDDSGSDSDDDVCVAGVCVGWAVAAAVGGGLVVLLLGGLVYALAFRPAKREGVRAMEMAPRS